jgi:hypothetical protein
VRNFEFEYQCSLNPRQVRISKPWLTVLDDRASKDPPTSILTDYDVSVGTGTFSPLRGPATPPPDGLLDRGMSIPSNSLATSYENQLPVVTEWPILENVNPILSSNGITLDLLNTDRNHTCRILANDRHVNSEGTAQCINQEPTRARASTESTATESPTTDSCEFVFILEPAAASGKTSPPKRRGRLDSAAHASSMAVKALGACWKCKILRKKVKYPSNGRLFGR